MAIHAAHVALVDLREDPDPSPCHRQGTDSLPFRRAITMIELEDQDVGLAAIDARVRREVGDDLTTILVASSVYLCDRAADVVGLVGEVVGAAVRGMTDTTVVLPGPRCHVGVGELFHWLAPATHRTTKHALVRSLVTHELRQDPGTTEIAAVFSGDGSCRT